MNNLDAFVDALPGLGEGILVTLQLTLGGAFFALIVALILGLGTRSRLAITRGLSRIVIEFFRGTSLLVQLFWLFYVLPLLGFRLDSLFCGILALALNFGAYGAEVVRGGIAAVPRGQFEASVAVNFSPFQRMRLVIFPQAWAQMLPPFTNLLIQLLKGTALATYILLHDLNFFINELRRSTGDTLFAYGIGLVLYFVIAYLLTLLMKALEVRAKHTIGTGPSLREVLSLGGRSPFASTRSKEPVT
jgi:polar amino acid transport system permease protein